MHVVRQLLILLVLAGIGYGGYWGWQTYFTVEEARGGGGGAPFMRRGGGPASVVLAPVEARSITQNIEAVGSTRAKQSVAITADAAGTVTRLSFTSGQQVKAGQVLLRLDDTIERADVTEAEASLKQAQDTLDRSLSLKRTNAVALAAVDSQRADVIMAEAELKRATQRLKDRIITAPFAGVMGFTDIDVGDRLQAGDVVAVLDDLSAVSVEFSLPEIVFARVGAGIEIAAAAAAFEDRVFTGEIVAKDSRIDPVSRSFDVRATIQNEDRSLPAGMFMYITVMKGEVPTITVPEEAIFVEQGQVFVFAAIEGDKGLTADKRQVSIGQRHVGFIEIKDGLTVGEQVVVMGHQRVRPGRPIKIHDPNSTGPNATGRPKGPPQKNGQEAQKTGTGEGA